MTQKHRYYLIISNLCIFIIITYSLFTWGVQGGYDPVFHIDRIHTLATNLSHGHFPNPIGFEYLNHFGYGLGFFYGNFCLYPFALLNILGISSYHCYLLFILCCVLAAIVAIDFLVHTLFKKDWATIVAAPLYLSSYYYIGTIYFRGAAGELLAFAITPWIFLGLLEMIQGHHHYWPLLAVSFALLLVTHILSFFILAATALLLIVLNLSQLWRQRGLFLSFCKSAALFLGLSMVFILPFIEQYFAQTYLDTSKNPGENTYLVIADIANSNPFFSPSRVINLNGGFIFTLFLLSIIWNIYQYQQQKNFNHILKQAYSLIFILGLFIISPLALRILVKLFPPIILLQIINRLNVAILPLTVLVIAKFCADFIATLSIKKSPILILFLAAISIITIMIPLRQNKQTMAPRRVSAPNYFTYSISRGEYEPQALYNYIARHNFYVVPNSIARKGHYHILINNHQKLQIQFNQDVNSALIMCPRTYYLGYQAFQNHKKIPITSKNGLVTLRIRHISKSETVNITYRLTKLAKLGWMIFIITLISMLSIFIKKVGHT